MPKFSCRCGYVINLSNGMPSFEMALIPDSRIEKIADSLDESENVNSDAFYALIDEVKKRFTSALHADKFMLILGMGYLILFFLKGMLRLRWPC